MEEQSGFRPGRSCTDNLFCIKQLIEKSLAHGSEMHIIFIDLKKAYDSVPISKLWVAMEENKIPTQYINAVKELYDENISFVKNRSNIDGPFLVNKGLRQGCCLSPTLFKVYLNSALKIWNRKCNSMGVQVGERNIQTLLFADDQVILAEDEEDAEYMLRKLVEEYEKWGLELNMEKTQYMTIGTEGRDLNTEKGNIKRTSQYKYLGVLLTEDGKDDRDILQKIGKGRAMTHKLHGILWNNRITKKTKTKLFKSLVEPCITYGSEVWTLTQKHKSRLKAVENAYWRRCCKLTILDRVRVEKIHERMSVETTITDNIEGKQLSWYGHLQRMPQNRIPKAIWNWVPRRRKRRGRPRTKWAQNIKLAMEKRHLDEEDWHDKKIWREGCNKRPNN